MHRLLKGSASSRSMSSFLNPLKDGLLLIGERDISFELALFEKGSSLPCKTLYTST